MLLRQIMTNQKRLWTIVARIFVIPVIPVKIYVDVFKTIGLMENSQWARTPAYTKTQQAGLVNLFCKWIPLNAINSGYTRLLNYKIYLTSL